jgi:glycosyltransferase involved in cell wall biosynthesis
VRVVHLVTKLGIGGAERMAETLATASVAEGFDVSVLAVGQAEESDVLAAVMRKSLEAAGVHVVLASRSRSKKASAARAAPGTARYLRDWKPDVVHVHTEVPQAALALARLFPPRGRRPATVLTVHSSVNWPKWGRVGRLAAWMLRDAVVVAVSESARRSYLENADGRRCGLVPNGVKVEELGRRPAIVRRPPRYLYASRLEPEKGIDTLMDALDLLESSPADFGLTIMGSGRLEADVTRRVETMSRDVRLHPPSPTLRSELREYDALVMPSKYEGLALLAVEALCVGLPVLATSAAGLTDTLPPGYPGCVPPADPGALAQLLEAFESDPSPWLGRSAPDRRWARRRYDSRTMVKGYAGVYEAAVGGAPAVAPTRS